MKVANFAELTINELRLVQAYRDLDKMSRAQTLRLFEATVSLATDLKEEKSNRQRGALRLVRGGGP